MRGSERGTVGNPRAPCRWVVYDSHGLTAHFADVVGRFAPPVPWRCASICCQGGAPPLIPPRCGVGVYPEIDADFFDDTGWRFNSAAAKAWLATLNRFSQHRGPVTAHASLIAHRGKARQPNVVRRRMR